MDFSLLTLLQSFAPASVLGHCRKTRNSGSFLMLLWLLEWNSTAQTQHLN